jgi:hypothetical protein
LADGARERAPGIPSIENTAGDPQWDRAQGDGLVGKRIVVGMTFLAADRATSGVDANSAIAVAWQGVSSGQAPCIPPGPVTLPRGSISESSQDPDEDPGLLTAWSIRSPMGDILMAACTDRSLL